MQVKQLEYLLKVVECGSITQAAEQLYISQPSLTKSIRNLEEEYGIQILIRKTRGVELTNEGKNFVHYAKGVLTAAMALDRNFIKTQGIQRSRLFLASQQLDFIYPLMLKTYQENREKHIHYNLVEADRNEVARLVLNGEVDLGFLIRNIDDAKTFLWYKDAKRLDIRVLDRYGVIAGVGPLSPFYERTHITLEEAESCPHVVLDMEAQAKENLYFDNQNAHYNLNQIMFFNTVSACEHFLMQTDALMYVSKWTTGLLKNPQLHIVEVDSGPEDDKACNELLWMKRAGEPLNPTERQFLRMVYQYFEKSPGEYPEALQE